MDESATTRRARQRHHRRDADLRDPVSRSAEFVAAVAALSFIVGGLLLRTVFGAGTIASFGAGCFVAGLILEVYARGIGAWSARNLPNLAVLVAVIGSPAVLWHALSRRRGPLRPELGGLVALLLPALAVALIWAQSS